MATITTDWQGEKKLVPEDGKGACPYCNSMRFVLAPGGELKPCPTCNRASYLAWAEDHPQYPFQGNPNTGGANDDYYRTGAGDR